MAPTRQMWKWDHLPSCHVARKIASGSHTLPPARSRAQTLEASCSAPPGEVRGSDCGLPIGLSFQQSGRVGSKGHPRVLPGSIGTQRWSQMGRSFRLLCAINVPLLSLWRGL